MKKRYERKFIACEFNNNSFVIAADNVTKEEALKVAQGETECYYDYTADDVKEDYAAWRLGMDNYEFPDGAYWLGMKGKRGAFPVFVIGG